MNNDIGEGGFLFNDDGSYPDVHFHDPESDFIDAVEKAVIQVDKEDKQMEDNKEYIIELSVEDERFISVNRNWFGYGELLKDMIEQRSQRYPECTQRFVLLNEIRALFGGVIDEEG